MYEFDRATAIESDGEGRYTTVIDQGWAVGGAPNGGYLMAILARAGADVLPHPHPYSMTAHFLRRTALAPAVVTAEQVRSGRTHSTAAVSLWQEDREMVRSLMVFGDHATARGPTSEGLPAPDLPPPEELVSKEGVEGIPEIAHRFDPRLSPASIGFALGIKGDEARLEGVTRFIDDRPPDPIALITVADSLLPAVMNVADVGWVPTLEMTVHVRGVPEPGWLTLRLITRVLRNGYLEEDGEIWDSSGTLVAMSRQLALALPPGGRG